MPTITFLRADQRPPVIADAPPGTRLLDLAQALALPLEGTCEGQMACSTCHVIVAADDFARLAPACDMEEDMLDLAAGVTRTSRLACQLLVGDHDLVVTVPANVVDQSR